MAASGILLDRAWGKAPDPDKVVQERRSYRTEVVEHWPPFIARAMAAGAAESTARDAGGGPKRDARGRFAKRKPDSE